MSYTSEDYILFFLAIILIFGGLGLLGAISEWQENRKEKRRECQLQNLNHYEDLRRRHKAFLIQMNEVLESVNGRRSA